jgi:TetR/AcrR family transcriptional regulator, cholesterol catabolism regulator
MRMTVIAAPLRRRDQLVDVATSLFSEHGYDGTSVRDIAEAAGIRAASVYAHVARKEDFLYRIVADAAERFMAGVEDAVGSTDDPVEQLRLAMRAHVRVVAEDVRAARVFHHEWRALTGERLEEVIALRDRYEGLWDVIVGRHPGKRPRKLSRLLVLSAANWVYTWYDPRGSLSPDQVADGFTDLLLRGLGTRPGRKNGKVHREVRT